MARRSAGMNIAELERMLDDRRSELNKLGRQRSELEKKLYAIDKEIARLGGQAGGNGRRRGGGVRARNGRPLPDVIEAVFRDANRALRVPEIVDGVLAAGYQSGSANFKGIVNQTLIKDKRFGQVERGVYQLLKKPEKEKAEKEKGEK